MSLRPPAPRPCESCPYRVDVPSAVWSFADYEKLRDYDDQHGPRMMQLFQCHQVDADSDQARLCGGWVGCHGADSLGLRMAVLTGSMDPAVFAYESPVELFASGNEAADHGQAEMDDPREAAVRLMNKIARSRPGVIGVES
ncbi:DUF6283 family protein [Nocardia sp. NPDC050697]|uniref:DUF6283 family protein n=1 Tax=Nocardia sp. NPDC050697 TaxID=3155158 RepID=UPI003401B177